MKGAELRKIRGKMTRAEFGDKIGRSSATVYNYETDSANIPDSIAELALSIKSGGKSVTRKQPQETAEELVTDIIEIDDDTFVETMLESVDVRLKAVQTRKTELAAQEKKLLKMKSVLEKI